jgi:hypothetical protein
MYQCGQCNKTVDTVSAEWTEDHGWRSVCQQCRLVITLTATGRIKFIRVGG